jgi:hypothetical protein
MPAFSGKNKTMIPKVIVLIVEKLHKIYLSDKYLSEVSFPCFYNDSNFTIFEMSKNYSNKIEELQGKRGYKVAER